MGIRGLGKAGKVEMIGAKAVCGEAAEEVRGAKRGEMSRREIEQITRVR